MLNDTGEEMPDDERFAQIDRERGARVETVLGELPIVTADGWNKEISKSKRGFSPDKEKKPDALAEIGAALRVGILPCTELASLGIPPREGVLGDWFMEGDLGFIFAPRGLGKTWLAIAIATAIARGGKCGPWQANAPRRVLYVDGEMPCEALAERIEGLEGNGNLTVLNHEVLFHRSGKVLNLADLLTQEGLTAWMPANGTKALFLDNLSCLFSGVKENDADAWEGVLPWLLTLRRHRIAVVLVHHSGRNKENMRGTSRREDAAFWVIRLDEIQGEHREGARFLSRFTKDRNSKSEQAAIEWSITTMSDGNVAIGTREASSMDVFRQWIEDGLTSAQDIACEMGVSKGTVSKMAKRAIDSGWLKKNGREYALA
jgi:AAA domain